MSRPKAKVLLSIKDAQSESTKEILEAEDLFAVFYNGSPVVYRETSHFVNVNAKQPNSRYKRFCYPHKVSALNMARKLNELYKTDQFSVYRLAYAEEVK